MSPRVCRKQSADYYLPNFTLESIDGNKVSLWDYRNRYNVVILFFDPSQDYDLDILRLFSMKDSEFADANAEILAIADRPDENSIHRMKAMSIPFHILMDTENLAEDKLEIENMPSIAVVDRYGILLMQCYENENINVVLEDIISELLSVEMQYPECGVSEWKTG